MSPKIKTPISKPEIIRPYKNRPNSKRETLLNWEYAIQVPNGLPGFPVVSSIDALNAAIVYAKGYKDHIEHQHPCEPFTSEIFQKFIRISDYIFPNVERPICMTEANVKGYLKKIQDILDKPDASGDERIFYFEQRNRLLRTRIFYKQFHPKYKYSLCIFKTMDGTYYVITDLGKFFNSTTKQKYCMECNRYYEQSATNRHNSKCPIRCQACLRINPKDGRCKATAPIECKKCNRVSFFNYKKPLKTN